MSSQFWVDIRSNQDFQIATEEFDRNNGTKTYFAYLTLREIFENFCVKNPPE